MRPANLPSDHEEEVAAILNPNEMDLFQRMPPADKHHCYRVMRTIKGTGHSENELLAAAILHDVGKTEAQTTWWDRPLVVLAEVIAPAAAEKWANGSGQGLSRPFKTKAMHAEWGADLAVEAGSAALTVELIRRHHPAPASPIETNQNENDKSTDEELEQMLALLRRADGIN
ncbi:MAG TPA: HD domain-containing protein [candidate division Zixibacteria bacterium]|nr:HD domain-containing protein [candidate division Zixibacteria bacterium]